MGGRGYSPFLLPAFPFRGELLLPLALVLFSTLPLRGELLLPPLPILQQQANHLGHTGCPRLSFRRHLPRLVTPSRPSGHLLSGFVEQRSYSDPTAATKCQGSTRSASQECSDNHSLLYLFFFSLNSNKCLLKYSTNHNDLNNNQPMQCPTYRNLGNR